MAFPISCFSCNKRIASLEEKYFSMLDEGKTPQKIFEKLNITRYCCKRMFLGYVDVYSKLLLVPNDIDSKNGLEIRKRLQ